MVTVPTTETNDRTPPKARHLRIVLNTPRRETEIYKKSIKTNENLTFYHYPATAFNPKADKSLQTNLTFYSWKTTFLQA